MGKLFVSLFGLALLHCGSTQAAASRQLTTVVSPKTQAEIQNDDRCKNVKCKASQNCVYGACLQRDVACDNITCKDTQRCNLGLCVAQAIIKPIPSKSVCEPLGADSIAKINCSSMKQKCQTNPNTQKSQKKSVCGYKPSENFSGSFANTCQACSKNMSFVYERKCMFAPRVCSEDQICLNGFCTNAFNINFFKNQRNCNDNKDCVHEGKKQQQCVNNKCIRIQVIGSVFQKILNQIYDL